MSKKTQTFPWNLKYLFYENIILLALEMRWNVCQKLKTVVCIKHEYLKQVSLYCMTTPFYKHVINYTLIWYKAFLYKIVINSQLYTI